MGDSIVLSASAVAFTGKGKVQLFLIAGGSANSRWNISDAITSGVIDIQMNRAGLAQHSVEFNDGLRFDNGLTADKINGDSVLTIVLE